jgi:hypothetical protein
MREERTAANERFCVIAAVTPQIMQCKLASYYPAASSMEAATTQSRHHVVRHPLTAQCDWEAKKNDTMPCFGTLKLYFCRTI